MSVQLHSTPPHPNALLACRHCTQVRDLLPAHPHLRVVLMSATLHVDLFSGEGC